MKIFNFRGNRSSLALERILSQGRGRRQDGGEKGYLKKTNGVWKTGEFICILTHKILLTSLGAGRDTEALLKKKTKNTTNKLPTKQANPPTNHHTHTQKTQYQTPPPNDISRDILSHTNYRSFSTNVARDAYLLKYSTSFEVPAGI